MTTARTGTRGPLPQKRGAILRAARSVFGRLGFAGASIEVIAAEAAVSTRTIYNHFAGKEQLFATVLVASSAEVAAAREELVERHLDEVGADLEAALVGLAREWTAPPARFADHFALVERIHTERDRLPAETFRQWREAGPLRARRALACRFERLGRDGRLAVDDADTAARHFLALVAARDPGHPDEPADPEEVGRAATAGVRAFLRGHGPR